jgi:hypothetical protein
MDTYSLCLYSFLLYNIPIRSKTLLNAGRPYAYPASLITLSRTT